MEQMVILCTTVKYIEFPELLFGTSPEGNGYFDATAYIQAKGDTTHSVSIFRTAFLHWESALSKAYNVPRNDFYVTSKQTGHILIDEVLALLFVSYIDPYFCPFILDRIEEVLLNGFSVSDMLIRTLAKDRLGIPPESIDDTKA